MELTSEKEYKYVKSTIGDKTINGIYYDSDESSWYYASGDELIQIKEDIEIIAIYSEIFEIRVYSYEDKYIRAVVSLSDASDVPDDARFIVTNITPDASLYNYEAYMNALNESGD